MNVLFIYSKKNGYSYFKPLLNRSQIQFGISYLSSYMKSKGHKTSLLVLTRYTPIKNIVEKIESFRPDLICFTAVFSEYAFISEIASFIKHKYPDIYCVAGGVHVSLNPDECVKDAFDAICIGEGEEPLAELAAQLSQKYKPAKISNLWIKTEKCIEKNSTRPFIEDLDSLPFPDSAMWNEWMVEPEFQESTTIMLGRGCPFLCSYCSNHALQKISAGRYVRYRSSDNIVLEVECVSRENTHLKKIYFEIETFTVNKSWALDLCEKLKIFNEGRSQKIRFGVNIRVTPGNDFTELFPAMKAAGFDFVNIGLESGSERIRRDILKRNYSNADIFKVTSLAKENGLKVSFYIMIGIPDESLDDFRETIEITKKCSPDYHSLNIFFPYKGTTLYNYLDANKLLPEKFDFNNERTNVCIESPGFTKKQILHYYSWFDYYAYSQNRYEPKNYLSWFYSKIKISPLTNSLKYIMGNNRFLLNIMLKANRLFTDKKI